MSNPPEKTCMICNNSASEKNGPLFPFGYKNDQVFHINCLNSPDGKKWIKEYRKTDSTFNFYWKMISWHNVICQNCKEVNGLFPKMRGHSPEWEACCDRCDKYTLVSPYSFRDSVRKLCEIMDDFFKGKLAEDDAIKSVQFINDKYFQNSIGTCTCGGTFSMIAKPRCLKCKSEVSNSLFHFTTTPNKEDEL